MVLEIEEEMADKIVNLQKANLLRYETQCKVHQKRPDGSAGPSKIIVGGFVRSYKFFYEDGKDLAQGTMRIEFSKDKFCECDMTVVILENSEALDGRTGERIVENTRKLADLPDTVLEAYFSTYCRKISKWIVVYEQFDSYFSGENCKKLPGFFAAADKLNLSDFWREKVREKVRRFIEVLAVAGKKKVVHGGLSREISYAISSGTVKLVNVARNGRVKEMSYADDLGDMKTFLAENPFLMAKTCHDWAGFEFLLSSRRMNDLDWDQVVLGHPFLLDCSGKLGAYEEIEIYMWSLRVWERKNFASMLRMKMQDLHGKTMRDFLNLNDPVYKQVNQKTNHLAYIYLNIIQVARNLINHANDNVTLAWDDRTLCWKIQLPFGRCLSMAYSMSKVTKADQDRVFSAPEHAHLLYY